MPSSVKFFLTQVITFTNLSLGVIAIMLSDVKIAAILIIIAALFDRLDGKIARKLNVESDFGKELDSLSDLISFGVAPAYVAWKISLINMTGIWGYIPVLIFIMAGAFRLARYNVTNFSGAFVGMPITIAGAIAALSVFFKPSDIAFTLILLVLSFLMVSTIKIKKL